MAVPFPVPGLDRTAAALHLQATETRKYWLIHIAHTLLLITLINQRDAINEQQIACIE